MKTLSVVWSEGFTGIEEDQNNMWRWFAESAGVKRGFLLIESPKLQNAHINFETFSLNEEGKLYIKFGENRDVSWDELDLSGVSKQDGRDIPETLAGYDEVAIGGGGIHQILC